MICNVRSWNVFTLLFVDIAFIVIIVGKRNHFSVIHYSSAAIHLTNEFTARRFSHCSSSSLPIGILKCFVNKLFTKENHRLTSIHEGEKKYHGKNLTVYFFFVSSLNPWNPRQKSLREYIMHACIWKVHGEKKNFVIFEVSIKSATRKPRSAFKTKSNANSPEFLFIGCYKWLFRMNFNAARAPFNQLLLAANCRHSATTATSSADINKRANCFME